jgi:hypothetical protein
MAEQSLFGTTPEALMASRDAALRQQAAQYAQLDPFQQATMGIYQGANKLGGVVGGMLGGQDPEMMRIKQRQQLLQGVNPEDPDSLIKAAQQASQMGDYGAAQELSTKARAMQLQKAQIGKATAEQAKLELAGKQEIALRDELAKLGPNATQQQILNATIKYGDANKVLSVIQSSVDKEATRAQALDIAKQQAEARVEAARLAGESRETVARIAADARKEVAQLVAALKGPSAAVLKAQEKADKIAEGQEGLSGTIETAKTLVNDLAKKGGMTTTSASPLANLVTSLGAGTVGQYGGKLFGTEVQSKRDELNSVRLQLFNAVKEATGMSSTQLNSNVELQTWLKSLGSDTMTKEANLAILNNISDRYLKKGAAGVMPAASTMAPADKQALDWANANPNDARAAAIKKKLGV